MEKEKMSESSEDKQDRYKEISRKAGEIRSVYPNVVHFFENEAANFLEELKKTKYNEEKEYFKNKAAEIEEIEYALLEGNMIHAKTYLTSCIKKDLEDGHQRRHFKERFVNLAKIYVELMASEDAPDWVKVG